MLRALEIRDMLIMERLDLEFEPGLNALTGETGAGKSILLDALGFVLGWRGPAELVREGAERGEVSAVFDLCDGHPARAVLEEAGLPAQDELVLRRINTADGRKTAYANDRRCSGETLRRLSDVLVELHGQRDDRGLLDSRGHRRLLDAFGGLEGEATAAREAWRALREARAALEAARSALEAARADEEYLRHAVEELDRLDPQPGEEAELDRRRRVMREAEKLRGDIEKAAAALGSEGARGSASDALKWLEGASEDLRERLAEPVAALGRALVELDEAETGTAAALDELRFAPSELEQAEERLFAIRALARKHGVAAEGLGEAAESLRGRLASLERGEDGLRGCESAASRAEADHDAAAAALTKARRKAAKRLDRAMAEELPPLKLERAVFETLIAPSDPGPEGRDDVTFSIAANPGAKGGPIGTVASGGELSRLLLALKVCLTGGETGMTMIFDEIDRGVGGATADAVGRRLEAVAQAGQVLAVTHSPQVAARAAHHWRVEKSVSEGRTLSTAARLGDADRELEIARMLSGDRITDEARAAARALLAG